MSHRIDSPLPERIQTYQPGIKKGYPHKNVVLVGGCFDILHLGHIRFLEAAKQQGDYLIVALEPDSRIIKYKKHQPMHTQQQRAEILSHLRDVDEVLLLPELHGFPDYLQLVQTIQPNVIAATKGDPQLQNKMRQSEAVGAQMMTVVDRIDPFSSTSILKKFMEAEVES
jgi:cytidyltransferase-like protein